jgi:putative chitinase
MITLELLQKLNPRTHSNILEHFVEPLNAVADHYELNTVERLAAFLAQTAHESGGFTEIEENLNYSAQGLQSIFHKYFDAQTAEQYARHPQEIANRVYANRMGNGDEASGDGWKFHGRGLIQLTGKQNYSLFANSLGVSLDDCVQYMCTPEGATVSAAWFWDNNGLNRFCDNGDFVTLTKRINGGTNGIEDRQAHYELALQLLKG